MSSFEKTSDFVIEASQSADEDRDRFEKVKSLDCMNFSFGPGFQTNKR